MGLDSGDVTAIAATVTAVAALAVAVWDNVQQRELAERSVMPLLTANYDRSGASASVEVKNEGVGPALVRELRIDVCGTPEAGPYSTWSAARGTIEAAGLEMTGYGDLSDGAAIGSGQSVDLVAFRSRGEESEAGDPVQELINQLAFEIRYESIYGETSFLSRRSDCLGAG